MLVSPINGRIKNRALGAINIPCLTALQAKSNSLQFLSELQRNARKRSDILMTRPPESNSSNNALLNQPRSGVMFIAPSAYGDPSSGGAKYFCRP